MSFAEIKDVVMQKNNVFSTQKKRESDHSEKSVANGWPALIPSAALCDIMLLVLNTEYLARMCKESNEDPILVPHVESVATRGISTDSSSYAFQL